MSTIIYLDAYCGSMMFSWTHTEGGVKQAEEIYRNCANNPVAFLHTDSHPPSMKSLKTSNDKWWN